MLFKFRPFIISLFFIIVLEFGYFFPNFFLLIFFLTSIILAYLGKKMGGKWIFASLPGFFSASSIGMFFLVSSFWQRQIFLLIATAFLYLILLGNIRLKEYALDQTGKGMIMAGTATTAFFAFSVSYGFYLNFLVPLWILMLVYFFITLSISYQYLSLIKNDKKQVWTYSLLLSLTMMELIWIMSFWPFGYLTTGVVSLILYYVLWDLTQNYFLNLLSRKRVVANLTFFPLLIFMVLFSAKWLPVF